MGTSPPPTSRTASDRARGAHTENRTPPPVTSAPSIDRECKQRSLENQRDLALHAAREQLRERARGFGERVTRVDVGVELAVAYSLQDVGELRTRAYRLAPEELPPEHAEHGAAFEQEQVGRNARDLARGESDHQYAAV